MLRKFSLPLHGFLGRSLDSRYYGNVIRVIALGQPAEELWCACTPSLTSVVPNTPRIPTIGFTGTQNISNLGFRVTCLLAQVIASLGYCTTCGNAYGVDLAVMIGTLERLEFAHLNARHPSPAVRQIVALPSGIKSRAPRIDLIEKALIEDNGLYISLLASDKPLLTELLSPRDRLIVDLSDALVVTEAGDRGAFDTIIWAIESSKPILAVDWGPTDTRPERAGCHILRELKAQAENPSGHNSSTLAALLKKSLDALTSHYHFSPAHPFGRATDSFGSNVLGFQTLEQMADRLVEHARQYFLKNQKPLIHLLDATSVTPPHDGDRSRRAKVAEAVAKLLHNVL